MRASTQRLVNLAGQICRYDVSVTLNRYGFSGDTGYILTNKCFSISKIQICTLVSKLPIISSWLAARFVFVLMLCILGFMIFLLFANTDY
ncbi:hypothetical protein Hanom_Chr08g00705871 [Helianthus anomalus]